MCGDPPVGGEPRREPGSRPSWRKPARVVTESPWPRLAHSRCLESTLLSAGEFCGARAFIGGAG